MAQNTLGKLALQIVANTTQFESALQRSQRTMGKMSKKMTSMGKTMSVSLTAPIAALGVAAVRSFDKQAKAIAQVEQGLKSTGNAAGFTSKQLQMMASDLQKTTLFGDEDILKNATAQLLTFTNITGDQFAKTQKAALDLATRLDGDLKSASIQLGKALNDPVTNLSALSRSGIQFSEDQKSVIKELAETNRLAEAQDIILEELNKQYGGSAEAAVTGAGKLKQLGNTIGDIGEQFGEVIIEFISPFIDRLKDMADRFSQLSPAAKKFIVVGASIAAAIGPALLALGSMLKMLPLIKVAMAALQGPIGIVTAAIIAIGVAVVKFTGQLTAAEQAQQALHDVNLAAQKAIVGEKVKLEQLLRVAKDKSRSDEDRKLAIKELNSISPEYLGNLSLETINTQQAADAVANYTRELEKRAKLQAAQEKLVEIEKRLLEAQEEFKSGDYGSTWDKITAGVEQNLTGTSAATTMLETYKDEIEGLNAQKQALIGVLSEEDAIMQQLNASTTQATQTVQGMGNALASMRSAAPGQMTSIGTPGAIAGPEVQGPQLQTGGPPQVITDMMQMQEQAALTEDSFTRLGQVAGSAFEDMARQGANGLNAFVEATRNAIRSIIKSFLAEAVAGYIAKSIGTLGPFGLALAGAAPAVVGGLFDALIPAFAKGGMVSGPTLAMVGDNINASRDPEIISPLSKLKGLMGESGGKLHGEFRLEGNDLVLAVERTNKLRGAGLG